MLNCAERTGSGALILVWSFLRPPRRRRRAQISVLSQVARQRPPATFCDIRPNILRPYTCQYGLFVQIFLFWAVCVDQAQLTHQTASKTDLGMRSNGSLKLTDCLHLPQTNHPIFLSISRALWHKQLICSPFQ